MTLAAVIGARGFIGANICAELRRQGFDVRGLVGSDAASPALADLDVEIHRGAPDNPLALTRLMNGAEFVFYAAAYNPRRSVLTAAEHRRADIEVRTVLGAFESSGAGRLIYTGASCQFWSRDAQAHSTLAQIKSRLAEHIAAAAERGLDIFSLIPTHCIGERDARKGSGALVCALIERRMPAVTDGYISPVDIVAVARAHIALAREGARGEIRIVHGPAMSVPAFVNLAAEALGVRAPTMRVAASALYPIAYTLEWLSLATRLRSPLTVEVLDLLMHSAPLAGRQISTEADIIDAVRRAAAWYVQHGQLSDKHNGLV